MTLLTTIQYKLLKTQKKIQMGHLTFRGSDQNQFQASIIILALN